MTIRLSQLLALVLLVLFVLWVASTEDPRKLDEPCRPEMGSTPSWQPVSIVDGIDPDIVRPSEVDR